MSKKRWLYVSLIIIFLLLIAAVIYGYFIYQGLMKQKKAGYDKTMEQMVDETDLSEIDKKYKYFGEENYHIFFGTTKDKEEKVVFFPLDKDAEATTIDQTDVISKEEVEDQWKNGCKSCKLMKIRPAMDDDKPLWEITYKDEANRLVLDYVSFEDGSDYEQYRFKQMIN